MPDFWPAVSFSEIGDVNYPFRLSAVNYPGFLRQRIYHDDSTMTGSGDHNEKRYECVDCGKLSPPTETNYTLISSQHGWRLTLGTDPKGTRVMEWRCPKCWAKRKAAGH